MTDGDEKRKAEKQLLNDFPFCAETCKDACRET
jgi:hypothetical protein